MEKFDFSQAAAEMKKAVAEEHAELKAARSAEAEYRAELDASIFETRDLLRKMAEESNKESRYNHRVNLIIIIIALLTLITTVISLFR